MPTSFEPARRKKKRTKAGSVYEVDGGQIDHQISVV
jgi:hypothetical protein